VDARTGTRGKQRLVELALLLVSLPALADSKLGDFVVSHWGRENGLPDNSVTCLAQTRDGYLWVGTAAGLARFDGVRFAPLNLALAPARTTNEITALYQDVSERLWIGTRSDGLWCLAGGVLRTQSWGRLPRATLRRDSAVQANGPGGTSGAILPAASNRLTDYAAAAVESAAVTCIAGNSNGDLWVGTAQGLERFKGTNLTVFTAGDGLPSDFVSGVHPSSSGTVWITTRKGMCQFKDGRLTPLEFQTESPGRSPEMIGMYDDQRGNLWAFGDTYLVNLNDGKRFNYFRNGDTTSLRIWSLCEGRDGQLWIGTSGQGVFAFSDGRFRPLSLRDASLGSDVQAIYEDRDGSLWLGTFSGGLLRLQPRRAQMLDANAGLPSEMPSCLAAGSDGRLWAGYAGAGLFSSAGDRFDKAPTPEGLGCLNLISSLAATSKGELWLGTLGLGLLRLKDGGLARLGTENGLADDAILSVAAQPDDSVWVGTRAGTVHHVTARGLESFSQLSGDPVTCLLAGASGSVWVGTENGGLSRLVDGRFVSADSSGILARTPIRALCEDADGRLWVGTEGRGLACLYQGRFTVWDAKVGFPGLVNGLAVDDLGKLWLCTDKGIFRMARPGLRADTEAVPGLELVAEYDRASTAVFQRGWPQAVKAAGGRLWFASPNGLCVVDPRDFRADFPPLPVEVGPIEVNGRPLAAARALAGEAGNSGPPLRLPSGLRTLEVEFTVPSVNWPGRIQFQHRLDPFDSDWVEGGTERRVRYSGLPFGQYQFRIRARNLDGTWGPENGALAFDLPPPLWRSPLVLSLEALLSILAVAAAVRLISHRRLRFKLAQLGQQQATERERMRIARDMHDELGAKLTRISYLSELALQDEVTPRQKFHDIAQGIRDLLQTVDEIVWAVDPQNDTLESLAVYLGHHATEYLQNTSVECELNIAPDLPVHPLTAETRHNLFLAFEEAVSNALKHSGATRLRVDLSQKNGSFEISIEDNGRGFELPPKSAAAKAGAKPAGKRGNGLKNMRQRLAGLGGEARIESQRGQGTRVTFILPIKPKPKDHS
jgi:ligand-binding sensor domain-containing protein/signal transduction histidine kinase